MQFPRNPVVLGVLKVWRFVTYFLQYVRQKSQELFDWFMNKLTVFLCKYYIRDYMGDFGPGPVY
jgi:hypothetical protein